MRKYLLSISRKKKPKTKSAWLSVCVLGVANSTHGFLQYLKTSNLNDLTNLKGSLVVQWKERRLPWKSHRLSLDLVPSLNFVILSR